VSGSRGNPSQEIIMHDEDDFLRALLDNPADDTTRLVYADWLDERNDADSRFKALFLRLTARLPIAAVDKEIKLELQLLAAKLDTGWLAIVSRLKIENCGAMRARPEGGHDVRNLFELVCDRRWDELTVTDEGVVRFCDSCHQSVYYCDTIMNAREHARQGHCVAVDLGIIRRNGDLRPPRMLMGGMLPTAVRQVRAAERAQGQVDEVSRERERWKKRRGEAGSS
jgi:uncharacterized protein (TIGR02996 family)